MSEQVPIAIGIDVGGSGIKGAAVDLSTGRLASNRHRLLTPQPATPQACLQVIARIVKSIARELPQAAFAPVGVGVPSVVIGGVTKTAANIDPAWVGFDAGTGLERILRRPVRMVNDADAAGLAEMRFGAGIGRSGTVIVLTLGTGLGSGFFVDGRLVPNTELGHMEIRGRDAERRSAAAARVRRGLSWKAWAEDLDEHLNAIHRLFWPSLLIIGGGVSKNADRFIPRLTVPTAVVPATLKNEAGIVGAALFAAEAADAEGAPVPVAEPEQGSEAAAAADEGAGAREAGAADAGMWRDDAGSEEDAAERAYGEDDTAEPAGGEEAEVAVGERERGEEAGEAGIGGLPEGAEGEPSQDADASIGTADTVDGPDAGWRTSEAQPIDDEIAIPASVTVAPAWVADATEGDAEGYPVAPATMASSAENEPPADEASIENEPPDEGAPTDQEARPDETPSDDVAAPAHEAPIEDEPPVEEAPIEEAPPDEAAASSDEGRPALPDKTASPEVTVAHDVEPAEATGPVDVMEEPEASRSEP